MASGIINLTSNSTGWYGRISWSSTVNSSALTSSLSVTFQIKRDGSGGTYNSARYTGSFKFNHDGTYAYAPVDTGSNVSLEDNGTWLTVDSGSTTISHYSNGSAPTITVTGSFKGSPNGVTFTAPSGATIDLGIIPIKATITSSANFTDEGNPTIGYSNPAGSNATSLQACIANPEGSVIYAAYRDISKTGSSYTFNLTSAERTALRNAVSSTTLSVRFYVKSTIAGSTFYSVSSIRTMTLTSAAPTLNPTVVDVNATSLALTGNSSKFVKGHNIMSYNFNASGTKGATITSYELTCGSFRSTSNAGTFTNVDTNVFTFTVTDSRGATASKTITLSMIDYVKLSCNQKVSMVLEEGEGSAHINLTVNGNMFRSSFGSKSNTITLYYRYSTNSGAMGSWTQISPTISYDGNTYSASTTLSGFNPSSIYTFQCRAIDALETAVSDSYAVKFLPVFDWSSGDFRFNVPVYIEGNPLLDYVIDEGVSGIWTWRKWANGMAELWGQSNISCNVASSWGSLYTSGAIQGPDFPFTFAEIPKVMRTLGTTSAGGLLMTPGGSTVASTTNPGAYEIARGTSMNSAVYKINYYVVGRWK